MKRIFALLLATLLVAFCACTKPSKPQLHGATFHANFYSIDYRLSFPTDRDFEYVITDPSNVESASYSGTYKVAGQTVILKCTTPEPQTFEATIIDPDHISLNDTILEKIK